MTELPFLVSGGAVAERIQQTDWSQTPLGPPDSWPESLCTTLSLCLACDFPVCLVWGKARILFYNDSYLSLCAASYERGAGSLGEGHHEPSPLPWPVVGPSFDRCWSTGEATSSTDACAFLQRDGRLEETFFTYSFSPIRNSHGSVEGVFHPVRETTQLVLEKRRLGLLCELAARTSEARSIEAALESLGRALGSDPLDLPFVLLFRVDPETGLASLAGSAGMLNQEQGWPLAGEDWPVEDILRAPEGLVIPELQRSVGQIRCGVFPETPELAIGFPITPTDRSHPAAVLIVGVSPRRPLDEAYRRFFDKLAAAVTASVSQAQAWAVHLEALAFSESARRAAEAANALKGQFLAHMSHEIRTPLNSVLGMAYLTLTTGLDERQRDYVEHIQAGGEALLCIVNNILDLAKVESGKLELESVELGLDAMLESLVFTMGKAASSKGVTLSVQIAPEVPANLLGDPTRLGQVLLNLVGNALKFTEDGEVSLSVDVESQEAVTPDRVRLSFAIRDTGSGMSSSQVERLFVPFSQADSTITRKYGGTGLGLVICKRFVELMGGDLRVESVAGEGSTFTFSALFEAPGPETVTPRRPLVAQRETLMPEILASTREAGRGARILVVEDNFANQHNARALLESAGLQVDIASDGRQALERVLASGADCPWQVVLMDLRMPEMDGYTTTSEIRLDERFRQLPILAMTASALAGDRERCAEAGMDDFISKPIDPVKLLATLRRWITLPFSAISGVDTVHGLAQVDGDGERYAFALLELAGDHELISTCLREAFSGSDQSLSDTPRRPPRGEALALVQALQISAATVGALKLAGLAGDLEGHVRQGETLLAQDCLTSLLTALDEVSASILGIVKGPATPGLARKALAGFMTLLDKRDGAALDRWTEVRGLLGPWSEPRQLDRVSRLVASFDFEATLAEMRNLDRTMAALA